MDAKISNGIGSEYVVLTNKSQVCSGVLLLFPTSDRLAFEVMQLYCSRLPETDADKKTLQGWLDPIRIGWESLDKSKRWENKNE